jgi:polyisoprenoid-binding protein YceI
MFRYAAAFALAVTLAIAGPSKPTSTAGSWQVDTRHSDAKLTTDGTTDFGKTKMDVVLGFARVSGEVKLDDADPGKSRVDLHIYPATSMRPVIEEDGNFKNRWMANLANHTLLCFHSKQIDKTPDGKLQVTGELKLTRVDRNVQADPNEAYAGPVYGPAMVHSVSRPATFVFDLTSADAKGPRASGLQVAGSTSATRESFPQLLRAVVSTYWPPLVQDANCQTPSTISEDYRGAQCTGTVLQPPALPQSPYSGAREDYPGPSDFNAVSGNQLTILLHMRLTSASSGAPVTTGD